MRMLGRTYKTVPTCRWHCCRAHSEGNARYKHSLKRLRAQEKRLWRKDQGA